MQAGRFSSAKATPNPGQNGFFDNRGEIIVNLLLLVVIPDRCRIILGMGVLNHRNAPPEGRPGENPNRSGPAAEDDDDRGVDRAGVAHGNQDTSVSSAALARKGEQKEPACELKKWLTPFRPRSRERKKPWRYRWPDEIRDEVLARLLNLNAQRAEEERTEGLAAATTGAVKPKKLCPRKPAAWPAQGDLLPSLRKDMFD
ncbi:MAG: hypothetical protein ACLQM8_08570 [Limisphaerales bacterium]